MLVQLLPQEHGGERSYGTHGQSALLGFKSLLLTLAGGCVLCPKQGYVSEAK